MGMDKEVERLKSVYRDYSLDASVQTRWDARNPGNRALAAERQREVARRLAANGMLPLTDQRILEIGCGTGEVLAGMKSLGARSGNLHGVDVLPEQIKLAKRNYPDIHWHYGTGEALHFRSASFKLIVLFTVFSSILDDNVARNVASEVIRVLQPGGAVLWYDFRYNNPGNPHVRGLSSRQIRRLFPSLTIRLRSISLLPILARRLSWATPALYPMLATLTPLRTHYLGLLSKPPISDAVTPQGS
jgi:ubiquinone/menaquinone biosynthesis C-methylase UbiE